MPLSTSHGWTKSLDVSRAKLVDNRLARVAEDLFVTTLVFLVPRSVADVFGQLQEKCECLIAVAGLRFAVEFVLFLGGARRVGSPRFIGFLFLPYFRGRRSFLLDVVVS